MHFSLFFLTVLCFYDMFGTFITLGGPYSLECLSDYISTITCSLNISSEPPAIESLYWLRFSSFEKHYNCTLTRTERSLVCMLDLSSDVIFNDMDSYMICLRSSYHGNNFSVVLDDDYAPKVHIHPVTPCNLSLLWNNDGAVLQWQSGYDPERLLTQFLKYQLMMYSKHSGTYEVEVMEQTVFVDESRFKPHTNYIVRVRSQPTQVVYKGVWSHWSPPLHWRSGNIRKDQTPERSLNTTYVYLLLAPILLVLLFCIPYSRCKRQEYVPSPAPYFRDWNLDDQIHTSPSGKVRDVMQGEQNLQIDILTENEETPLQQSTLDDEMMEMSDENKPTPQSLCVLYSPKGSEVDSGCWIRDVMATDRGSITYSEDYCTFSHSLNTYAI